MEGQTPREGKFERILPWLLLAMLGFGIGWGVGEIWGQIFKKQYKLIMRWVRRTEGLEARFLKGQITKEELEREFRRMLGEAKEEKLLRPHAEWVERELTSPSLWFPTRPPSNPPPNLAGLSRLRPGHWAKTAERAFFATCAQRLGVKRVGRMLAKIAVFSCPFFAVSYWRCAHWKAKKEEALKELTNSWTRLIERIRREAIERELQRIEKKMERRRRELIRMYYEGRITTKELIEKAKRLRWIVEAEEQGKTLTSPAPPTPAPHRKGEVGE